MRTPQATSTSLRRSTLLRDSLTNYQPDSTTNEHRDSSTNEHRDLTTNHVVEDAPAGPSGVVSNDPPVQVLLKIITHPDKKWNFRKILVDFF